MAKHPLRLGVKSEVRGVECRSPGACEPRGRWGRVAWAGQKRPALVVAGRPIKSSQRPRQEVALLWSRTRMLAVAEESSHCRDRCIPEAEATGLAEDRAGVKDDAHSSASAPRVPSLDHREPRPLSHARPRPDRKCFTILQGFYQTSSPLQGRRYKSVTTEMKDLLILRRRKCLVLQVHRESCHFSEKPGRWFLALQGKLNAHVARVTEVPTSGTRLRFLTGAAARTPRIPQPQVTRIGDVADYRGQVLTSYGSCRRGTTSPGTCDNWGWSAGLSLASAATPHP